MAVRGGGGFVGVEVPNLLLGTFPPLNGSTWTIDGSTVSSCADDWESSETALNGCIILGTTMFGRAFGATDSGAKEFPVVRGDLSASIHENHVPPLRESLHDSARVVPLIWLVALLVLYKNFVPEGKLL